MADANDWENIKRAARAVHGGLGGLLRLADEVNSGHEQFKAKHWGQSAGKRNVRSEPLPNVEKGLVELGPLVELVYLTKKGGERRLTEYQHAFERPYPMLTFAGDGSGLVIVRDRSEYTVTNRGIEG